MELSRFGPMVLAAGLLWPAQAAAQTVDDPRLVVDLVASGFTFPTSMAFIGPDDILILQKEDGLVRRVQNGVLLPTSVLDVAVDYSGERGLLGIAVDSEFVINHRIFIYYTESSTGGDTNGQVAPLGNRVYRYTWDGMALVDPVLVLDLPAEPGSFHLGGVVTIGPDGALYTVIGDLGRRGQLQNIPSGAGPDDSSVILRTGASGAGLQDNPFFNRANPADPMNRYFAYGVRNSFGLAFDPKTGWLWDTENGDDLYDEVNRVVAGFNSGWSQIMGPDLRDPQGPGDLWMAPGSSYRDPEFSWYFTIAPTALAFPSSPVMGCALRDDILMGDVNCGVLWRFKLNAARDGLSFTSAALQDRVADNSADRCSVEQDEIRFGSGFGVVTDMENGPDGRLYVVSAHPGRLFRIGPRPGSFPDPDADGVDSACDCAPNDAGSFASPVEVHHLGISAAAPQALGWDAQAAASGAGTTYTLVTGDLAALRSDGYGSACTLRQGETQPWVVDGRPDPPAGSGYYYLSRAENACGAGTFGSGTAQPDPRDPLDAAPPPPCTCATRPGGALVTFRVVQEFLTVWVTNPAFIVKAKQFLATGSSQVPIFTLLDGQDCDSQWTWHVDPQDLMFAPAAIELCDGLPSHVEGNKTYWLQTVGGFCPWSAVVTAVDEHPPASMGLR